MVLSKLELNQIWSVNLSAVPPRELTSSSCFPPHRTWYTACGSQQTHQSEIKSRPQCVRISRQRTGENPVRTTSSTCKLRLLIWFDSDCRRFNFCLRVNTSPFLRLRFSSNRSVIVRITLLSCPGHGADVIFGSRRGCFCFNISSLKSTRLSMNN